MGVERAREGENDWHAEKELMVTRAGERIWGRERANQADGEGTQAGRASHTSVGLSL